MSFKIRYILLYSAHKGKVTVTAATQEKCVVKKFRGYKDI